MIMMPDPLAKAVESVRKEDTKVVFLSPQGSVFDDEKASRLAEAKHLVLVCGHYEGVDERVLGMFDEELSIGDYVLTGGELPAMVLLDAAARFVPGVLGHPESACDESFSEGWLEYPQYTRPRVWRGQEVPEILFSGDHEKISAWRKKAASAATKSKRPDLMSRA